MGDVATNLLRFAGLVGAGRRVPVGPTPEDLLAVELARAEAGAMAAWAGAPAAGRFIAALRAQREAHKSKRMESYDNHLAMIAHSTWESALDWVEGLVESYKRPGQPAGE